MVPPLVQLKISNGVCASFAIIATVYRLYLRKGRYWWDDGYALFSLLFQLVQIAAVFLHVPDPEIFSRTTNIAAYYVMAATFYCIIWMARLSILFSIIRIDSDPQRQRWLRWVAGIFGLVLAVMICQLFWVCEPLGSSWKNERSPQCPLDKQVAICQLVTDILSDTLLLIAPLRLLSAMSAEDRTRRRLMFIFSTSVVTTIVSLVHAAFIFEDAGIKVVIAAMVENAVSLMVCNVPVLATYALRKLAPSEANASDESFDEQGSRWNTFLNFRTVKSVWSRSRGGSRGGSTTRATTIGLATRATTATTATGVSSMTEDGEGTKSKAEGGAGLASMNEYRDAKVTWMEPTP